MQCKICEKEVKRLASHVVRTHKIDYRDYLVEYEHNGRVPKCECGCGQDAPFTRSQGMSFKRFIHGHHANVRVLSEESRQKIGDKNREHMKRFMAENPDIAKQRAIDMENGRTPDVEERRIAATREAYENMSDEERTKFSEHSRELWVNNREKMLEASALGGQTFSKRYEAGEYDFEERNAKISDSISQKYVDGGFEWGKGKYTSTKSGKRYHHRSSWERSWMIKLDRDTNVVSWDYEPIRIPYDRDGQRRFYVPDFVVRFANGQTEIQEVKPKMLTETPANICKAEAGTRHAQKNGWEYRYVHFDEVDNNYID